MPSSTLYYYTRNKRAEKKRRALKKKVCSSWKSFYGHMHASDWIGHVFLEWVNREEKSHADWTNRHILEQINHEEKRQTVSFQFNNMVHAFFLLDKLGSTGKYYQNNKLKKYYRNVIDQIFHYTCCITLNKWARPICASLHPGNTASVKEMWQPWRAVGNTIWPARDLNFEPPAPETNALPLNQQIGKSHSIFSIFYLGSTFMWELP